MADEQKKKEFMYRGRTIQELKQLGTREFAKLLKARERRNVFRNFQRIENFLQRAKEKEKNGKKIRTHLRDIVIVPEMVGKTIHIYNGKDFAPVEIMNEMIGHKLGEFALTRKKATHTKAGVGATKGTKHKAKQ
ncbi:MAG: 30S ribosomal protein S19 [Candidatus Pacearchaeota archaeon]